MLTSIVKRISLDKDLQQEINNFFLLNQDKEFINTQLLYIPPIIFPIPENDPLFNDNSLALKLTVIKVCIERKNPEKYNETLKMISSALSQGISESSNHNIKVSPSPPIRIAPPNLISVS